jgi:hypothetical protein
LAPRESGRPRWRSAGHTGPGAASPTASCTPTCAVTIRARRSPAVARAEATEALSHLQLAAALFHRAGRPDLQAAAWDATGEAYLLAGRAEDSAGFHRQAAAAHRSRGDTWSLAVALTHLADALVRDGELPEAQEHRHEAVQLLSDFSGAEAEAKRSRLEALLRPE